MPRTSNGTNGPWLRPDKAIQPVIAGLLRSQINQYDDGSSSILTPKKRPQKKVENSAPVSVPATPPAVCVPVSAPNVEGDPASSPYTVGEEVTFTIGGLSGSEPYFVRWYLNFVFAGSNETFVHTITEGDIVEKDGSGLGKFYIYAIAGNACGSDSTDPLSSYPAQGTP